MVASGQLGTSSKGTDDETRLFPTRQLALNRGARWLGFTLIELVVVLVIIATIAGFVIPQVSGLGRSSDMAASAKTQADLANNLQLFFVLQKRFPQGWIRYWIHPGRSMRLTPRVAIRKHVDCHIACGRHTFTRPTYRVRPYQCDKRTVVAIAVTLWIRLGLRSRHDGPKREQL